VDSGFYAACAGLKAQSLALDVAAHNIANVNTVGFRGQQVAFQTQLALARPSAPNVLNLAINNFGVLEGTHLDLNSGNIETTGNPLDAAIEGRGFFAVQTPLGVRYTRGGSFRVARNGQLTTSDGNPVLSDNGVPIQVPAGAVAISPDGTLSANGAVAGRIRLVEFAPETKLTAEGNSLLAAPTGSERAATQTTLRPGALEASNVNAISGMVELIGVQRKAEMMQRALSTIYSEFNRIAANDLPRV
jgi:flagellar basal-body rod protein FlgF